MATVFIVARLWAILGRAAREPVAGLYRSARSTGRTAVAIVVESGLLYLVTQLIFVVLYSIQHPAIAIQTVIAVQIYVSVFYPPPKNKTEGYDWCRASRRRSSSFGLVSVSRLRLRKRLCRQVRSRGLRAVRCSLQGITPTALARQGRPRLKQRMGLRSS